MSCTNCGGNGCKKSCTRTVITKQGARGFNGPPGVQGEKGIQGAQGIQGITGLGFAPWAIIPLGTDTTAILASNSRTIYTSSGADITFATPSSPTLFDEIEILYLGAGIDVYIAPATPGDNQTVQIWRSAGFLSADGNIPERVFWDSAIAPVEGLSIKLLCTFASGSASRWVVTDQTWNNEAIIIV